MLNQIVGAAADLVARFCPAACMEASFMRLALLALLLLAPLAAVSGIQVVNSRMAFFSDAIGHSAFAGVALGLLLGVGADLSMPLTALAVGLLIIFLKRCGRLSSDTVIGVIFSAVAAFGLAIVARSRDAAQSLRMFLFGDILTISEAQIATLFALLAVFTLFQIFAYNRLLLIGVNPMLAAVHRVKVGFYRYAFAALLALVVMESVRATGVILVTALLIVPAATARNLAKNSASMFYLALAASYLSSIAGLLLSAQQWANIPAGAAIVLVSVALFLLSTLAAAFQPKRGSDTDL